MSLSHRVSQITKFYSIWDIPSPTQNQQDFCDVGFSYAALLYSLGGPRLPNVIMVIIRPVLQQGHDWAFGCLIPVGSNRIGSAVNTACRLGSLFGFQLLLSIP